MNVKYVLRNLLSFLMRYLIPRARVSTGALRQSSSYLALHSATGKLTTISHQEAPTTREIEIWLGDPGESYAMFEPKLSRSFQTGIILQGGCSLAQDYELYLLTFRHATRHFSYSMFADKVGNLELICIIQSCSPIRDLRYPKIFRDNRM